MNEWKVVRGGPDLAFIVDGSGKEMCRVVREEDESEVRYMARVGLLCLPHFFMDEITRKVLLSDAVPIHLFKTVQDYASVVNGNQSVVDQK